MPRFPAPLFCILSFVTVPACGVFAEEGPADAPAPAPDAAVSDPGAPVVSGEAKPNESVSAGELRAMLAKLAEIRARQEAAERGARIEAMKALDAAVTGPSGALSLYVASVKIVEFEKLGRKQVEFDDWRKRNEERLHDGDFSQALLLQYRFLKLSLEADTEEKRLAVVPAVIRLGDEMIKAYAQVGNYARVLHEDPFSSPVAARFGLEKRKPEGWPASPLQLGGVHNLLMKPARISAPKSLPALWEGRIRQERAFAAAREDAARIALRRQTEAFGKRKPDARAETRRPGETEGEKFEKITLPRLQWEMGMDLFNVGFRRRGLEGLFFVLTKNPDHPSQAEWLKALSELAVQLDNESGSASVAPALAPPPAPHRP